MLRVLSALLLAVVMTTVRAQASSFVVVAPPTERISPSMVVIGASQQAVAAASDATTPPASVVPPAFPLPEPGETPMVRISPSIVAYDSPVPNVADEKVAAISADKPVRKHARASTPMVMRGGIVGEAFAPASASAPRAEPAAVKASPQNAATSMNPKRNDPASKEPKPVSVAPPPPDMPRLDGVR